MPTDIHYHHCPECYDVYVCNMNCTIVPDLEDPISYPGYDFGSHCVCGECSGKETLLTKEWWDIYHGFKKKKK